MPDAALQFLMIATGLREPARQLGAGEMVGRAVFAFTAALLLIRVGRRRLMSHIGPFDLLVTMIIGSTISRGITGNAPLLPSLAACAGVIAIHWLIAALSSRSPALSAIIQGKPITLVRDGHVQWPQMHRHTISHRDLAEAVRLHGAQPHMDGVVLATLERSGNISVIHRAAVPPGGMDVDLDREQTLPHETGYERKDA